MWLTENLATMIICVILAAVVTLVIISMVGRKKKGRSSCNCAGCPMSGSCHHGK
ncbi:FeoB-associated Cys-rich membrane protein [Caprobacter fermentans]|uniref:FeoB-associated Cys-rich membrane protein n=1 Tax=Caproicibacter fermentans TaxID=2576756 RepID=A0A6N8I2S6_9FIRM|nr:FeoB-associated Cys-rich membrane protein [Caproicibacter fermentans]MVB12057.1 FeoB-associated Cys-rich membrane protein [Caproicibacter fermentans]QNK40648.1 FeoB-associated Cys-rich membrane protein [Caproicibacter fermentans]